MPGEGEAEKSLHASYNPVTPPRVFISHSSRDREIATRLVELLRLALGLPSGAIRCTSVGGSHLDSGVSIDETLRSEVHDAEVFVGLITPNSIESAYVLFESGARWGAGKTVIPLLASGVTPGSLRGPLKGLTALDCTVVEQLQRFVEQVEKELSVPAGPPSSYHELLVRLAHASASRTFWRPPLGIDEVQMRLETVSLRWTVAALLLIAAVAVGHFVFKTEFVPADKPYTQWFYGLLTAGAVASYVVWQARAVRDLVRHRRFWFGQWLAVATPPVLLLGLLYFVLSDPTRQ